MGGKTSAASKNKWQSKNCDRINFVIPKGTKETIKNHVMNTGESVNGFILRAVRQAMEQDEQTPGFLSSRSDINQ